MLAPVDALTICAAALAVGGVSLAPPPDPGPWKQLGRTVTSRPGNLAHFDRIARGPQALGVVAGSTSRKPIRLTWFADCEQEANDGMSAQHQGSATHARRVVVYPPVMDGATFCTVSVTVRVAGGRAGAAVFDY